jgi:ring-1,2-phenylacetyl-CoA epoxidase subunit PaaC
MSDVPASIFDGLLDEQAGGATSGEWAFGHLAADPDLGTDLDADLGDPLAGVDTTVPDGVDPAELAQYCLMLGDDALVLSQRVSAWCSRAPEMEDDVALANVALDLLGQARLLLARAAVADPGAVPSLPEGSPVPPEDRLAFFRDAAQFRNVRLVEVGDGDFAHLVVRLLLFATARTALLGRLRTGTDRVLAAVAARGVKEVAYHRDWAARWFLTLAQGTDESRRRLLAALDALWPLQPELVTGHAVERTLAAAGAGVDPRDLRAEVDDVLDRVFAASGVDRPRHAPLAGVGGRTGRDGVHTEALSRLLAELQVVARAHPTGRW